MQYSLARTRCSRDALPAWPHHSQQPEMKQPMSCRLCVAVPHPGAHTAAAAACVQLLLPLRSPVPPWHSSTHQTHPPLSRSTQSSKARTKTSRVSKARALLHMRALEGGTSRSHRECWVAPCTAILEAQQALLVQWTAFQRRRRDTSTHRQAGNWLRWHMPCALSLDGQCCLLQLCSPLSTLTRKHSHHMP